jgi:protease-4
MLQFFKYLLASFLAIILFAFIVVIFIVGLASSSSKNKSVNIESNSILKIDFNKEIEDQGETSFDPNNLSFVKTLSLREIVKSIEHSGQDPKIKALFLDMSSFPGGFASLEEIRNALVQFKKSHKPIYAYGENFTEKAYYLNSLADKLYLNPEGLLEFNGLSSEYTFYKGALDKLGIDVQIFRVGKYKSFVEPYTLEKMSEANRDQITSYLGSIYHGYMEKIAQSRNYNLDSLIDIADNQKVSEAGEAEKFKLVTGLRYRDEVLDELKTLSHVKTVNDIHFVSLADYDRSLENENMDGENRIQVIYASGDIVPGEGSTKSIGSEQMSRIIRHARLDKDVKALVLRVNSPGGSSLASDVIWREVYLTQKIKPVVVSMGDVAASGGYYISCAAGKIYAEPNTITGSIGIFGIIPNTQKFFNEKLGITFDRVNTGKYSDILTVTRPLKEEEKAIIQNQVNHGYQSFLDRVSKGRNKSKAEVDSIAQGRVWTGEQAIKNGLVDKLGGLDDAIEDAANQAHLTKYSLSYAPDEKSFLQNFLTDGMDQLKTQWMEREMGMLSNFNLLKKVKSWTGIQARMLEGNINP